MPETLKQQLIQLVLKDKGAFAQEIRARFPRRGSRVAAAQLRNFILVMPEMIAQIRAWVNNPSMSSPLKRLHGFVLSYLYIPVDFLPDDQDHLFGYLDDAYLVGRVFGEIAAELGPVAHPSLPSARDLVQQLPKWLRLAKRVIPEEAAKVDRLVKESTEGRREFFEAVMAGR